MGKVAEKTAEMILKKTGNRKKAEDYTRTMNETIEKVKRRLKDDIDPIYQELAAKIDPAYQGTTYLPRILEKLMTLAQARIAQALPDPYREPSAEKVALSPEEMGVSGQFAKDLGMDKETVDRYSVDMYEKGLLFPTRRGWQFTRNMGQFHDSATNNPKVHDVLGHEYFELWTVFNEEEWSERTGVRFRGKTPLFRVVPRWRAIKDIPGVMPYEDVRQILQGAQDNISLTNCPCRKGFGNRTCDIPVQSCINFGRVAQYNIKRGTGRRVTPQEALDVLNELDKHGVTHIVRNDRQVEKGIMCNCHFDCCIAFQGMYGQSERNMADVLSKSRFEAVVDLEKCKGCRTCVRVCNFEAAKMKDYPEFSAQRSYTDTSKCMGCGSCVVNCPSGARTLRMWQPDPNYVPDQLVVEY